jgi:hypothetical protein
MHSYRLDICCRNVCDCFRVWVSKCKMLICVCVHIYIHICSHIYIHAYIHICLLIYIYIFTKKEELNEYFVNDCREIPLSFCPQNKGLPCSMKDILTIVFCPFHFTMYYLEDLLHAFYLHILLAFYFMPVQFIVLLLYSCPLTKT